MSGMLMILEESFSVSISDSSKQLSPNLLTVSGSDKLSNSEE